MNTSFVRASFVLALALPVGVVAQVAVVPLEATVGGGSLPGETLLSAGLEVRGRSADTLLTRLRTGEPAILARVAGGAVLLDLRTVDPDDDAALGRALVAALTPG